MNAENFFEDVMATVGIGSESTQPNYLIAEQVEKLFISAGMQAKYIEKLKGFKNVVGSVKTKDFNPETGKVLFIFGHTDTKPVNDEDRWNYNPLGEVQQENGKEVIYGRGSADCKGHLVASIEGTRQFIEEHGLEIGNYAIYIAAWTREEIGDEENGIKAVLEDIAVKKDEPVTDGKVRITYAINMDGGRLGGELPSIFDSEKAVSFFEAEIYPYSPQSDVSLNPSSAALEAAEELLKYDFKGFENIPRSEKPTINVGLIDSEIVEGHPNTVPSVSSVKLRDIDCNKFEEILNEMKSKNELYGYKLDREKRILTIETEDGHGSLIYAIPGSVRTLIEALKKSAVEYNNILSIYTGTTKKEPIIPKEKVVMRIDTRRPTGLSHEKMHRVIKDVLNSTGFPNKLKKIVAVESVTYPVDREFSKNCMQAMADATKQKVEEMRTMKCPGATLLPLLLTKYCDDFVLTGTTKFEMMHRYDENATKEELKWARDFIKKAEENTLLIQKDDEYIPALFYF